jgi:hypothetical protein
VRFANARSDWVLPSIALMVAGVDLHFLGVVKIASIVSKPSAKGNPATAIQIDCCDLDA